MKAKGFMEQIDEGENVRTNGFIIVKYPNYLCWLVSTLRFLTQLAPYYLPQKTQVLCQCFFGRATNVEYQHCPETLAGVTCTGLTTPNRSDYHFILAKLGIY